MKRVSIAALLVIAGTFAGSSQAALNCWNLRSVFSGQSGQTEAKWREQITNADASGEFAQTSSRREAEMKRYASQLTRTVLYDSATPVMDIFFEPSAAVQTTRDGGAYGTHIYPKYKLSGLGPTGVLKATLLLPVSGHTGPENARKWAKTDKYSVYYTVEGKRDQYGRPTKHFIAQGVTSKDVVTYQEITVPLEKGKVVTVYYDREGSAGPHGFIEGRAIDFEWSGN